MAAEPKTRIPILTEEIGSDETGAGEIVNAAAFLGEAEDAAAHDRDTLIAELQTELASNTFALTDEIMRQAFAEMEASVFEQVSGRLRRELPEMIDALLRERLGDDPAY